VETVEDRRLELASRRASGIEVSLLWDPADDSLTVVAADDREEERVEFGVRPEQALEAYRHPFAYAPSRY